MAETVELGEDARTLQQEVLGAKNNRCPVPQVSLTWVSGSSQRDGRKYEIVYSFGALV